MCLLVTEQLTGGHGKDEAERYCALNVHGPAGAFICRWHGDCRPAGACQRKSTFLPAFLLMSCFPVYVLFCTFTQKTFIRNSVIDSCRSALFSPSNERAKTKSFGRRRTAWRGAVQWNTRGTFAECCDWGRNWLCCEPSSGFNPRGLSSFKHTVQLCEVQIWCVSFTILYTVCYLWGVGVKSVAAPKQDSYYAQTFRVSRVTVRAKWSFKAVINRKVMLEKKNPSAERNAGLSHLIKLF